LHVKIESFHEVARLLLKKGFGFENSVFLADPDAFVQREVVGFEFDQELRAKNKSQIEN